MRAVFRGGFSAFASEQRSDGIAGERAEFERAGRNDFGALRIDTAIQFENAEAGAESMSSRTLSMLAGSGKPDLMKKCLRRFSAMRMALSRFILSATPA